MSAFFRIHDGLAQEAPGSRASTLQALAMATDLPADPVVADVGCGPGPATQVLAEALPSARIVAIDLHAPFVAAVAALGLGERVTAVEGDMADLPGVLAGVGVDAVDLLWCEGAAYALGFQAALRAWAPVVRPGGCLALTDAVWLAPTVSRPVLEFWEREYPAIQPAQVRRAQIRTSPGWDRIGDFTLPAADWEAYYGPLGERLDQLRPEAADDPDLAEAIAATEEEIAVFDGGGATMVGYQFFVLRRV